ncbi:hypothetical protein JRI60_11690 [Archangium violaceum]|uniref:hypothetical protein n=1 Tax=Archangium violaceum TaxID=83451 RepID=UPI00194F1D7D|nr:hypothetical protein [Archangium violaceum]QRN99635.1 hypothetical protein JRI60_11690 [Archangium violaceum]
MPPINRPLFEAMLERVSTSNPDCELEFSQMSFKASPGLYLKGGLADTLFMGSDWMAHNVLRTYSKDGNCLAHAYFWCADHLKGTTAHWRARAKSARPRLNTSQVMKMQHKLTKHLASIFSAKDEDPVFTHRVFNDTNIGALFKDFDTELNARSISWDTRQFSRAIGAMGVYFMRKRVGTDDINARYLLYHLYGYGGDKDTKKALTAQGIDFDAMKKGTFLLYTFKHALGLHGDGDGIFHLFDPNYGQYQLTFDSVDGLLGLFNELGQLYENDTHGKYLRILRYELDATEEV